MENQFALWLVIKKMSECIQYISGYNADINDGKIKKILNKYRQTSAN